MHTAIAQLHNSQKMKKLYLYLSLCLPLLIGAGCAKADSAKTKGSKAKTTKVATQQSKTNTATAQKPAAKPAAKGLSTGQSQLDFMKNSANWAKYQTGILPQMASDAPEYCAKILNSGKKHFVIVDKGKMHLFLYDQFGNVLKKFPIACAKNYGNKRVKGDSRTNEGIFLAEGVYDSRNWLFTNDAGYTSPAKGVYGPWFIRVVRPIGIHGTSSPGSIGKRCSHGCIRVNNENIKELVKYVDKGTPIIVSPGPRDMAVNAKEGRPTLAVVTEPGTPKATPGNYTVPTSGSDNSTKKTKKQETTNADNSSESVNAETGNSEQNVQPAETPAETPVEKPVQKEEESSSHSDKPAPAANPSSGTTQPSAGE